MLAQGLTTLGAAAIGFIVWRFNQLIQAWGSSISVAPDQLLWRLGPANEDEKVLYRAALTLLFLALGAGLIRVIRLRVAQRVREGGAVFVALVTVVVSLLLLNEAPYKSGRTTLRESTTRALRVMSSVRMRLDGCCSAHARPPLATAWSAEPIRHSAVGRDREHLHAHADFVALSRAQRQEHL